MARSDQPIQADGPSAIDLEPYRQLVELQKEIAALAQQNDRAQKQCAELREGVASRVLNQTGTRRNTRQKVGRALAQLPLGLVISDLVSRSLISRIVK